MTMTTFDHLLAKDRSSGVTLIDHLQAVANFAVVAARYAGLDTTIARYGGLLHDIGKASPLFQQMLNGYRPDPSRPRFRHEIASLFFLELLPEKIWSPIIDMIIAHHKSIAKDGRQLGLLDLDRYYGDEVFDYHATDFENWSDDATGILASCGFVVKPIDRISAYRSYQYVLGYCRNRPKGWSVWKGLLVGADHLASALDGKIQLPNTLFKQPDVGFYDRQNELYPLSLIPSDETKMHTFVKAPTGAGKTDFLMKRCRDRIFYTLPFQASINAMYERFKRELKGTTDDIRVLHAVSSLVIEQGRIEERVIQDKYGASVKVMTPHQLAAVVFGTRGYEAILFDLKGCDIILDEIHTYSGIMQSIVLKLVEILKRIGCRIHIGTATMPSRLEDAILTILGLASVQYVQLDPASLSTFDRHTVYKAKSLENLYPLVKDAVRNGDKVLIVTNQVARAQAIYRLFEEKYAEIPKMLIHSRYKRDDRNRLERNLKEVFNKTASGCIVVSTQVVEVSLDINFDVLISDAAPIDALIQRFGRINRVRDPSTIGRYKSVYVLEPPNSSSESKPYSREVLERSYAVLPNGGVLKEADLQRLIDQVYPEIEIMDINLDAVFADNRWRLRELWHLPKSALLEKLDIDSVTCILEGDRDIYRRVSSPEKMMFEIPVSYNAVRWRNLEQLSIGNRPFVVPDEAYSTEIGLDLSCVGGDNHIVNYQIL